MEWLPMNNLSPNGHPLGVLVVDDDAGMVDSLTLLLKHCMLGGVADQRLALALKTTPAHDLVTRTKRARQQAVAVQPANPLAIDDVGLGPARRVLGLPRIDQ